MVIIIKQINAHNCRVDNRQKQHAVWKVLSYWDQGVERMKSILDCRGSNGCRFPVGLYPYVYKKLKINGHLVLYKPLTYPKINYKLKTFLPKIEFENYQNKMLSPIGIKNRGIIVGPTGSGKTVVMGGIIDKLNTPKTIIITPTKQILNQTYDHFLNWFPNHKIGKIGDGHKKTAHITIALFQSLKKF